jgi:Reverse transcriptase (RNA-dependent DNA polymerase)
MERYREQKKYLHMIFIDLEKAYDKISKNIMWWTFEKKWVPTKYIILIKDIYINIVICVKVCDSESDVFSIKIELYQGSALSPYIFTIMMNEITKDIQEDILWCMFFYWQCGADWRENDWSWSEIRVVEINFRIKKF